MEPFVVAMFCTGIFSLLVGSKISDDLKVKIKDFHAKYESGELFEYCFKKDINSIQFGLKIF